MSELNNYVCSNCGSRCGYDGRCGDGPYLVCKCGSPENSFWVNDGQGGYAIYLNNATPIPFYEYKKERKQDMALVKNQERWDREDD